MLENRGEQFGTKFKMALATDTNVNFIGGPKDKLPTITGNKYFIFSPGKTFKLKEDIIKDVFQLLSGQHVQTVEACDVILVFCFIVSRAGTDIDAALNELNVLSESKPAVFMVLHHTFDPEKIVQNSSRFVNRMNTLTVDCLFHEDEGLLKCVKNRETQTTIQQWLQPQVNEVIPASRKSDLNNASELILVLLGVSALDKTAVEHVIFGRQGSGCDDLHQGSWRATVDTGVIDGEQVAVINTTDWFSSSHSVEEMKQKIQFCIRLSSDGPYTFLLVIPGMQFIENIGIVKDFERIFEKSSWEKVIILFTVKDEQQKQVVRDGYLQAKLGKQFHVLKISETGDRSQVSELLRKVNKIKKPVAANGEKNSQSQCTLS